MTAQYLVDHAPLLSVTEAESHHGAVALQMAASNFTALACSGDNGMDKSSVDLLVIDALSEVMYSSCIHGHIPKQQTDVVSFNYTIRAFIQPIH